MAICHMLSQGAFEPNVVESMTKAYESALAELRLVDRDDPLTTLIAKEIIRLAGSGETNSDHLKRQAFKILGIRQP